MRTFFFQSLIETLKRSPLQKGFTLLFYTGRIRHHFKKVEYLVFPGKTHVITDNQLWSVNCSGFTLLTRPRMKVFINFTIKWSSIFCMTWDRDNQRQILGPILSDEIVAFCQKSGDKISIYTEFDEPRNNRSMGTKKQSNGARIRG